jgi:ribokinase
MSRQVVVVGSLNADHVVDVPCLPLPGDTVFGDRRLETRFGGKGANEAAAAFGGPMAGVPITGHVGDDEVGRRMTAALEAVAVPVQMESPPETVAAALRHASGVRILNPAPAVGAVSALGLADVVVPNRTELAILADAPVARTQDEVVAQVGSLGLPRPWS